MNPIDTQSLLSEMRAVAQQAQLGATSQKIEFEPQLVDATAGSTDFASMMKEALKTVNDQQVKSSGLKEKMELGDPDVELSEVMIQAQKASLAFQAMTQVRNKLVDAYKDVMSMPL
jgi:flagellar hook-basal body complex protein FliE